MTIWELLNKVPATFWGVVVGSFFTIIGVVLTNWSNGSRLRRQLEHDRSLKDRDRDLGMRRDIYLAAAEAISAGIAAIGRLGDLSVPHQELLQPFTDRSPAIAKIHIVGSDATIQAVAAFMEEFTGGLLRLSAKRIRLTALQQRLAFLQAQLELSSRERDRVLSLMKDFNLAGSTDERRWSGLQRNFDFEGQRTAELLNEQKALQATLFPAQFTLLQKSLAQVATLNRLLVPILRAVRAELELPFNEKSYTDISERTQMQQARHFEEFIRDATALLAEHSPNKTIEPTC